jgi:hypothetical protein
MLQITVVYSPAARQVWQYSGLCEPGSLVQDVLNSSGWTSDFAMLAQEEKAKLSFAIWGKKVELTEPVKNNDRIEIMRPLRVDPKVARRERFQHQGAKAAGLFAKRRPGAKPGY